MAFNPYQFKAFAHVIREGSLSAAAKSLGVSQSAVTQHISKLEATVGVRLIVRGRDGVELTTTGQEFYELADRYAALESLIREKLQGYSDLTRGQLKVIANAPQPALRLIARYGEAYPNVDIDFSLFDWSTAMELLLKQQTDIGIVTDPTQRADWQKIPITSARYVMYVRYDHPLAKKSIVSLNDLQTETLLLTEAGSLTRRIVTNALRDCDSQPRRIVKTTTFPVMKEAIIEGLGVGIFLEASAQNDGQLAELPIAELSSPHETSLIVPKHKLELRLTKSFVRVVEQNSFPFEERTPR